MKTGRPADNSLTASIIGWTLKTAGLILTLFASAFLAEAQPLVFGPNANGFYDAYQPLPPYNWDKARLEAACRSYLGTTGHLATIQSAQENAFVASVGGAGDIWIGLTDNEAFGGFEESGPVCCGGSGVTQTGAGFVWVTGESKPYQNWGAGEPNNYAPGEDAVHIRLDGAWNDQGAGTNYGQSAPLFKSVVEYDVNVSLSFVQARTWRIEVHKASPGVFITNLARADAVIAGTGRDYSVVSYYTHANMEDSGGAGDFGPNPGVVGVRDADDFAVQGTGYIIVAPGQGGTYVFRGNSDDGQRLRIDLNNDGDFNDPGENVIVDDVLAPPHNVDSAGIVLAAGSYRVEWTWFERGVGAEGELSASRNGGPFVILGNDEGGGLDVAQYPQSGGNGPAAPAGGSFPPAGIDSLPTTSPFSVTINGVTYVAEVSDPGTIVSRSGVTTEGSEGALPVSTIGCAACSPTVSDANVGCFPPGLGDPATRREIHTEMLSLGMCGRTLNGTVVCYLAGQPAANALAGRLPGQANYRNSFGEMVSKDPNGSPALDFPAVSFWAMRGVVTIFPPPPGTSGVFFSKDPVLMVLDPITGLPPSVGNAVYHNLLGVAAETGGSLCGALPAALYDAGPVGGPAPANVAVGQVNCGNVHEIRPQPDIFKWEQPPDLTNGLDVRATTPKILADDFRCTITGPITDIHIWGSWLSNRVDFNTRFCIGLWTDEPTNSINNTNLFSHPGTLLWSNWFNPCEYQSYLYATNANEQFYDPNVNQIIGPDSDVWYYSFYPTNPCWQVQGTIYWLSVTAETSSTNYLFGWKSSPTNFQDDAVFGHLDGAGNPLRDWRDMHYPPGHPYGTNRSINLAFRVSTPAGGGRPPPPPPPEICTRTNCLPPATKNYRAANLDPAHQQYGSAILQHLEHSKFTAWDTPPPTNAGASKVHSFGSVVSGLMSTDGGATFSEISLPADVRVRTTHDHMEGDMQVLRAEIESMEITNTSPPIRIRESPVLLSAGVTTVRPIPAGYAISSYFNVWTELSVDGGAHWIPSSVAGQMRLVESNAPPVFTMSQLAPPPQASFCEPPPDALWPPVFGPIPIRNIWHSDLPGLIVPPTVGQSATYSATGTVVQAEVSLDLGQSFQQISAPATVSVRMRHTVDAGQTRFFETEMMLLDISGGTLPFNVRMRESPTLPSMGEHVIRTLPSGFSVASYFDVFLEMSVDCGENWTPASRAIHMDLFLPQILITSVSRSGSTLTINWSGGKPPYRLQKKTALSQTMWIDVGSATSLPTATDTIGPGAAFYRVQGNQ